MKSQLREIIIENIKYFRIKKGISQLDLSMELQKSANYINGIENGNGFPSIDVFEQIAEILEVEPYELLLKDGCPNNIRKFSPESQNTSYEEEFRKMQQILYRLNDEISSLKPKK